MDKKMIKIFITTIIIYYILGAYINWDLLYIIDIGDWRPGSRLIYAFAGFVMSILSIYFISYES